MTIEQMLSKVVNDYVRTNGTSSVMDTNQVYNLVASVYPIKKNSFLPSDFCYNRTNEGIAFEKHVHLFERISAGSYLILGEGYPYCGPVYYRKKGENSDSIAGVWNNGIYETGVTSKFMTDPRVNDLRDGLNATLRATPVTVEVDKDSIFVYFQSKLMCGIDVEDNVYKLNKVTSDWAAKTTYHCEMASDGTNFYYLETIDECIGEVKRLVSFETKKESGSIEPAKHTSELSQVVSASEFENAYKHFIEQADRNAESKKAQGSKVPYGYKEKPNCDGAYFKAQYGQGTPSASPYMNWWAVSIYYLPENGNIILGIEVERYPHIKDIQVTPIRYERIGNKTGSAAVFYSSHKTNVDYGELYEKFIQVCEEILRLGLK